MQAPLHQRLGFAVADEIDRRFGGGMTEGRVDVSALREASMSVGVDPAGVANALLMLMK